jgi:hypothetical protein
MALPQPPEPGLDAVPPDNQPGHHPDKEQDKPDLDAFAAKLGTDPKAPAATKARKSAPAPDNLGPLAEPELGGEPEPRMVGLAMLPLRETVKRLEQLERALTERLQAKAVRGPRGR